MKHIFRALWLVLICANVVVAQQEVTLQLMNNVLQSTHTNPAFIPRNKVSITVLSSQHLNIKNTGFSYNQLLAQVKTDETGQRVLNPASLLENLRLNGRDYLHVGGSLDLFALNFKSGKNRFSLNVTEHFIGRAGYSSELFEAFINGNMPGETINFNGYTLNATHYREIGLGYNRKVLEDKLVVGGRLKMLHGMANIRTKSSEISIQTGSEADMYALTASADIQVKTSGLNLLQEVNKPYFLNTANAGIGIDLGATYELDTKWSFAASVINAGFINWKSDVTNYSSQGTFTFRGIEIDSLLTGGGNMNMTHLLDSVANIFKLEEDDKAYKTGLPTQVYLTSFYKLAPQTTASATIYSEFMGAFRKGLALGIRQNAGRWLQASATYSMQARSYNNLGLGLSFISGGGGVQLYMVTDNILGALDVGNAKLMNIRTGFNFVF